MISKSNMQQQKKQATYTNQNPVETLKNFGGNVTKKTTDEFKKIGSNIFDQFFGNTNSTPNVEGQMEQFGINREEKKQSFNQRKEFSIFNYQHYYESEIVKREMKQLSEQITKEIQLIKKAEASLLQEAAGIQKATLESLPDKPGIYHIRFFELLLSLLRSIRAKIGESKTWMQAMITKRKKRGSLFVALTKKKGTMYSLSQELQSARSIQ